MLEATPLEKYITAMDIWLLLTAADLLREPDLSTRKRLQIARIISDIARRFRQ